MPRTARVWLPHGVYHVDARAHSGAPIFALEEDRAFVVARAARVFDECGVVCLGWSVLIDHHHALVRSPGPPGRALLRLNTATARRVRKLGGGAGAVFQGRFFSGLCADESSTLARLAYVVSNPVHHRVVPSVDLLRTYRWSSLGETLGLREARLANPAAVLAVLHDDPALAREQLVGLLEVYARLWAERTGAPDEDEAPRPSLEVRRSLGAAIGAPRALVAISGMLPQVAAAWESVHARRAAPQARGWRVGELVRPVCAALECDAAAILGGRRTVVAGRARALIARIACDHLACPPCEVAAAIAVSGPRSATLGSGAQPTSRSLGFVPRT